MERSLLSVRGIHLRCPKRQTFVHPYDAQTRFIPFPLPAFPESQLSWLKTLAVEAHRIHNHYLAMALLMDTFRPRWVEPLMPYQQSHPSSGTQWDLELLDFRGRGPTVKLAGSFQYVHTHIADERYSLIPRFDGLHLLYGLHGEYFHTSIYLRHINYIEAITTKDIAYNDWKSYLDTNEKRLRRRKGIGGK
jgi:hypothetical protein